MTDYLRDYPLSQRNVIHHAEFFDLCAAQGDCSVDMILCDLPYSQTANFWDTLIPLEPMWTQYSDPYQPTTHKDGSTQLSLFSDLEGD